MTAGINIAFAADATSFLKGAGNVETALDKVSDSLDNIDGAPLEREMSSTMDNVSKDSKQAADKLEKSFSDAFNSVKSDSKKVGDDLGTHVKRGADEAGEGTKAFKENAGANFKEVGASFDGTVDSMASGLQGFIAEATEGFGPLGLAAGAAVAIGIGVLQSKLQAAADKINETKQQAADFAIAYRDATEPEQVQALSDSWDDLSKTIIDNKSWFEFWQKDAVTVIDRVATAAKTGSPVVEEFLDAFNDPDPIKRQGELQKALDNTRSESDRLGRQIDDLTVKQRAATQGVGAGSKVYGTFTDAQAQALKVAQEHKKALDGIIPTLADQANQARENVTELQALADAQGMSIDQYKATKQAAADAAQAEADAVDKAKQASADRQATLESEDQAYRSTLASAADLGTLLGDAWADPNSPLRKWADGQAKATKSADDTWADFQDRATPAQALQAVMDEMDAKIAANATFVANLKSLAERGFGALVEDLRQGGPEANGAITQALADGTDDTVQNFARDRGTLTGKSLIQGASASFSNDSTLQNAVNNAVSKVTPPNIALTAKVTVDDSEVRRWAANPVVVNAVARVGRPQVI